MKGHSHQSVIQLKVSLVVRKILIHQYIVSLPLCPQYTIIQIGTEDKVINHGKEEDIKDIYMIHIDK